MREGKSLRIIRKRNGAYLTSQCPLEGLLERSRRIRIKSSPLDFVTGWRRRSLAAFGPRRAGRRLKV
ncbi:hypothetical protein EVAR_35945_1 [Eumeta japonica]|uniref:Uncharacterized protein n=1 Tax=Eumeta variegata TaxID=151549 RepID=A0A4C1W6G5_EUMVA|nr:hypothetical protein EVAR_35945_1 [Eumeta japonica]